MGSASHWQTMFENWPASFEKQGIIITTTQAEPIPFINFMLSEGLLLVERDMPDTQGARKVVLSYESIASMKITSTMPFAELAPLGFRPTS